MSVDDVSAALRAGRLSPADVRVDYIVRDGHTLILNTRSAQALQGAAVPRNLWVGVNRTGVAEYEAMATRQLTNNRLTPAGTTTVRPSKPKKAMTSGYAIAVPLDIWKDPQGNLRITISGGAVRVEFDCWTDEGDEADYVGVLVFDGVWATRMIASEFVPYQIEQHAHHSYILRVVQSAWVEELATTRKATYTAWPREDAARYEHWVVAGHDEYFEVVARSWRPEQHPISA